MKDFTPYQRKVISRYYDNREQLDEQKLAELVTSLYLAKSAKQLDKLWTSAGEVMARLKVPAGRVAHLLQQRDASLLAEVVKDLQSGDISQ